MVFGEDNMAKIIWEKILSERKPRGKTGLGFLPEIPQKKLEEK